MTAGRIARRRERLAAAQGGVCPHCEQPLPADLARTEIDHIIPRACGGPDVAWNYQLLHLLCNKNKRVVVTEQARALAAEHGVKVHLPIPASAHVNRPFTREQSQRVDRLMAAFFPD